MERDQERSRLPECGWWHQRADMGDGIYDDWNGCMAAVFLGMPMTDAVLVSVAMSVGVSPLRGAGLLRCASSHQLGAGVSPLTGRNPSRTTQSGQRCRQI